MRIFWAFKGKEAFIYAKGEDGCFASIAGRDISEIDRGLRRLGLRAVLWRYGIHSAESNLVKVK